MPAPSRRNVGASLAHKITAHTAARGVAGDGSRMVAARTRQNKRWESAAARLSPGARATAANALEVAQDRRVQINGRNNQQNPITAFRQVLDKPCPVHSVSPGEPCWSVIAIDSTETRRAVCGRRIIEGGFGR